MTEIILWRRLDIPGHEIGRLNQRNKAWKLSGTALFLYEHAPCKLDYTINCDSDWRTQNAKIIGEIGNKKVKCEVSVENQKWFLDGVEYPAVAGCIDIDLSFSPSTNFLPIRRLSLAVGQEAEVNAAWLPFPSLTFELLPQTYRREDQHTYKYESHGGAFARLLEINEAGFVTNYPGIWVAEYHD
jgi:uncharacterized protein